MKAKRFILCVALAFLAGILAYSAIQREHTFTLSSEEGGVKAEQIQPLFRTVRVSGDRDTDVVFTDVETGEKYTIGYITHGSIYHPKRMVYTPHRYRQPLLWSR